MDIKTTLKGNCGHTYTTLVEFIDNSDTFEATVEDLESIECCPTCYEANQNLNSMEIDLEVFQTAYDD